MEGGTNPTKTITMGTMGRWDHLRLDWDEALLNPLSSRWFFFNIPAQVIQFVTFSFPNWRSRFQPFKFASRFTIPKKDASQKEAGSSSNHPFSGATFSGRVMQTPTGLSYSIRTKAFRVWSNHTILSKFCRVFSSCFWSYIYLHLP